jgi:hypothetical protein
MSNTEKAEILAREYFKMTERHLLVWKGNPTTFMGVGQWAKHIKNCSPQLTKKIAGNFWTMKAHELLAKAI